MAGTSVTFTFVGVTHQMPATAPMLLLPLTLLLGHAHGFGLSVGAARASSPRRVASLVAGLFSEEWMSRLGTQTNSKSKWVKPQPASSLGAGSVLLTEPGSFDHYFLESIVLLIEHDENLGSRGVLLNHETPWLVDEMSPGSFSGTFEANPLFLGGDAGKDTMLMIHGEPELPGARPIGRGCYVGGVASAVRAVEEGALPPDRFKFFFKTVEWLPNQLQMQVDAGLFKCVELSPAWLFGQNGQRSMWGEVRDKMPYDPEAEGSKAKKEDEEVTGAVSAPPAGLPYEKKEIAEKAAAKEEPANSTLSADELATEASRSASKMRKGLEEHRRARDAHDVKLRELVDKLVDEKNSRLGEEGKVDEAALAGAAADAELIAEPTAAPPAGPAEATEAAAWLAERGIVAPPSGDGVTMPATDAEEDDRSPSDTPWLGDAGDKRAMRARRFMQTEPSESPAAAPASSSSSSTASSSAAGIVEILGFRVFMGSEQWRVRWQSDGDEPAVESWEKWQVLDTDELRQRAEALRDEA